MSYEKTKHVTGIGNYSDYDAIREAKAKFYRNPEKYTREGQRSYHNNHSYRRSNNYGRVDVVIEHW